MKPNWFIGLAVPPEGWFDEEITSPPQGFRRFCGSDLHLTIAFLGAVSEGAARRAWEHRHAWREGAIVVTLDQLVPMGPRRRYSALSATLALGAPEAVAMIHCLQAPMLQAAGGRPARYPPRPHITVARPRRRASTQQRHAGLAWAQAWVSRGNRLRLDELALYTWSADRSQRLFERVESHPLG